MKLVPLEEFTDKMWQQAHQTVYSVKLAAHMGINPQLIENRPTLVDFYQNIMTAYNNGTFQAWGILGADDTYLGHTLLEKSAGEWEIGTVLREPGKRGLGIGAKASLHALKWAFEEDGAEWVVAFTQGKDPQVRESLLKGGFKPLMNFLVMSQDTWKERWASRRDKWLSIQSQQ